jgi:DNA-binding protein H-NS
LAEFVALTALSECANIAVVTGEWVVSGWEYKKLALNQMAHKTDDVDLLCEAGEEGWELVAILPNNIAYLKRHAEEPISEARERSTSSASWGQAATGSTAADASAGSVSEVKPKYRDPALGDTWSGRGRMATWLKRKQDAGEDIEKYRV